MYSTTTTALINKNMCKHPYPNNSKPNSYPKNAKVHLRCMSSTTKRQRTNFVIEIPPPPPLQLFNALVSAFHKHLTTTTTTLLNIFDPPLHSSIDLKIVFSGNFAPVDELEPTDCPVVEGEVPVCLNGVYIRNGPNPQHISSRPLLLFEGDGMLHSLKLFHGQATYCSRYVKTYKYEMENEAGFPIFPNFMSGFHGLVDVLRYGGAILRVVSGHIDLMNGFGIANTSLAFFSSKLLALGEMDLPYAINVTKEGDIQTVGRWEFERKLFANMTAHPKVDPDTNEAFAFRCSLFFPYVSYFWFDQDGVKQNEVHFSSFKKPTFIHDFAITKRFAIFVDTELVIKPMQMVLRGGVPAVCDKEKVPRIGVLSRYATSDVAMRWFAAPGFNALHIINSWENGEDEIILIASSISSMDNILQNVDKVHFSLQKLTINIRTGLVSRKTLSPRNLELGSINSAYLGKKHRYAYLGIGEKIPKMLGIVKIDLEKECEVSTRFYEPGSYGGEPLFVPRDANDQSSDEDDGFVVSYVHNENSGESSFVIMDAKSPVLQVLATVKLPRRIPYGFHGLFVSDDNL